MAYFVAGFGGLRFTNFSVEMCAGSLASGRLFLKHFSETENGSHFGAQNCDLGGLVSPFWQPGGPFWHIGGTWATLCSRNDMWGSGIGVLVMSG